MTEKAGLLKKTIVHFKEIGQQSQSAIGDRHGQSN